MKVRIYADSDGDELSNFTLSFDDIERWDKLVDPKDLIGKTITYVEDSIEIKGALILTLE